MGDSVCKYANVFSENMRPVKDLRSFGVFCGVAWQYVDRSFFPTIA